MPGVRSGFWSTAPTRQRLSVRSMTENATKVAAHAPATVVRRQNKPSQNAIPIIAEIFQKTSRPETTPLRL